MPDLLSNVLCLSDRDCLLLLLLYTTTVVYKTHVKSRFHALGRGQKLNLKGVIRILTVLVEYRPVLLLDSEFRSCCCGTPIAGDFPGSDLPLFDGSNGVLSNLEKIYGCTTSVGLSKVFCLFSETLFGAYYAVLLLL